MHMCLQLSSKDELSQSNNISTVYWPHILENPGEVLVKNTQTIYDDKPLKSVKIEKNGPRDEIRGFPTVPALIF